MGGGAGEREGNQAVGRVRKRLTCEACIGGPPRMLLYCKLFNKYFLFHWPPGKPVVTPAIIQKEWLTKRRVLT